MGDADETAFIRGSGWKRESISPTKLSNNNFDGAVNLQLQSVNQQSSSSPD
jgi:hypothetical protein